ncbi:MAG: hypothetical protein AAF487_14550 [Bacteroidota bacterium]
MKIAYSFFIFALCAQHAFGLSTDLVQLRINQHLTVSFPGSSDFLEMDSMRMYFAEQEEGTYSFRVSPGYIGKLSNTDSLEQYYDKCENGIIKNAKDKRLVYSRLTVLDRIYAREFHYLGKKDGVNVNWKSLVFHMNDSLYALELICSNPSLYKRQNLAFAQMVSSIKALNIGLSDQVQDIRSSTVEMKLKYERYFWYLAIGVALVILGIGLVFLARRFF